MSEAKALIIICTNVIILFIALLTSAGSLHDLAIMRDKLDAMQRAQYEQGREIREAKTDAALALRVVTTGDWDE